MIAIPKDKVVPELPPSLEGQNAENVILFDRDHTYNLSIFHEKRDNIKVASK